MHVTVERQFSKIPELNSKLDIIQNLNSSDRDI